METSRFCESCNSNCEKEGKVHDMLDIKPSCYTEEKPNTRL